MIVLVSDLLLEIGGGVLVFDDVVGEFFENVDDFWVGGVVGGDLVEYVDEGYCVLVDGVVLEIWGEVGGFIGLVLFVGFVLFVIEKVVFGIVGVFGDEVDLLSDVVECGGFVECVIVFGVEG